MRPAGPLPARVYWVRRLLLAVILVVALSLVWWAVGRVFGGGSGPDSAASAGGQSPVNGGGPAAAVGDASNHQQTGGDTKPPGKHRDPKKKSKHHRLAAPSGPCGPTQVDVEVGVHDIAAGRSEPVTLTLKSVGVAACTLAITPDTLALRITSGSDVVWSSDECPNDVLARELVVRAQKPVVYTFTWNGHRSTETCASPGKVAQPGGYWAEAALIGADAHRAYFDVT
jgi:hypothetical protein